MKRLYFWFRENCFGAFKSDRQQIVFWILLFATAGLWYWMDQVYQNNTFDLNHKVYMTDGTKEHTYTWGEVVEQLSGIPEEIMKWWILYRYAAMMNLKNKVIETVLKTVALLVSICKASLMITAAVFAFTVNIYVINFPKTYYLYWETGVLLFNIFTFVVLPYFIRKAFIVQVKSAKRK